MSTSHDPQERSANAGLLSTLLAGDVATIGDRRLRVRVQCRRAASFPGEHVTGQVVELLARDVECIVWQAQPLALVDGMDADADKAVELQRAAAARRVLNYANGYVDVLGVVVDCKTAGRLLDLLAIVAERGVDQRDGECELSAEARALLVHFHEPDLDHDQAHELADLACERGDYSLALDALHRGPNSLRTMNRCLNLRARIEGGAA